MINGYYVVSFKVKLSNMESKEEALEGIKDMLENMYAKDELPDMDLELVELEEEQEEEDDGVPTDVYDMVSV